MIRKVLLLLMMVVLFGSVVHADLKVSGNSRLDSTEGTYQQFQFLQFDDNTRTIAYGLNRGDVFSLGFKPITVEFSRSCEDISTFNSANPNNKVVGVNWTITHLKNEYSTFGSSVSQNVTLSYYDCTGICNEGNTPLAETNVEFLLADSDTLLIEMFTQYNDSDVAVYDSPCRFDTKISTFSCTGCESRTYQELTNELETIQEDSIYNANKTSRVVQVIRYNIQIWGIFSWIFKIALTLGIFALIVLLASYLFQKIKGMR